MATLLQIRTALNGEIGVVTDAETAPWTTAGRNQAITDGYAELFRVGVWKPVTQDLASVTDSHTYALTSIRRLGVIEMLDTSSRLTGTPRGLVEDDGSGGYRLRLHSAIDAGSTIRLHGYAPYKSVFSGDSDPDDLPAEHARVPRLKAKAILYRQQLALFARYGERQAAAPVMNMTIDQLLGVIAAAEREFIDEAKVLSGLRPRVGQPLGI